jgi:multidrug transporter EmrE-like cation transporter
MSALVVGLLMALATGILFSIVGGFFSNVARRQIDMVAFNCVLFGAITVASAGLCNWSALARGDVPQAGPLIIAMVLAGLCNLAGILLMMRSMRCGPQTASYTFAQCAMVWPFLAGVVIWHDPAHPINYLGVILIFASIVLLAQKPGSGGQERANVRWLVICLTGFLILGASQILCSIPSRWKGWQDTARLRSLLLYAPSALCLVGMCSVTRRRITRAVAWQGIIGSVAAVASVQTLLSGLDHMAEAGRASLLYPLVTGVNVTSFALFCRVWLKEHLGPAGWTGVAIGVGGILMLGIGR